MKIGLEVKTKPTEELTEAVEITEDVDPEQEIEEEVISNTSWNRGEISCCMMPRF